MAIYNRQYQKLLASELLRYLLLGKLPNLNDISTRVGNALDKKSNITFKYVPQEYKSVFNTELYNKNLRRIKFDIDVFHEELLDLFAESSSRLNFADLYHKINSYELKNLQSKLELLLFTVGDADFYFDGVFDTFSDSSGIDASESTKDIIDLYEQCLSLPFGGSNTRRVDAGSLISSKTVAIDINNPNGGNVTVSRQIPGSTFGSIFTDTLAVWGYEVVTDTNGPLDISLGFPLNPDGNVEAEFFVTRFETTPHSDGKQTLKVTTSNDNVNYIPLIGYEQGLVLEDQKLNYAMDFETTLVQYVRLNLSKTEADEEITEGNTTKYRYLFGLKRFAALQTGRLTKGTYVSKPLTFESEDTIGKVSLFADQRIPAGCSVNYSVAGITDKGQTSFIPITPVGQDSTVGSSNIVSFNTTNRLTNNFTTTETGNDAPIAYGTAFQGKEFYRIGPVFENKPIFSASKLYRGFKSWARDISGSFEILSVNDNYVSFQISDLEALYDLDTESPSITSLGLVGDTLKTQLQLSKAPYYDTSRGHIFVPQPGTQNSLLDTRPNYAIYKVLHKVTVERTTASFTLGSARTQYLPVTSFVLQGNSSDRPSISSATGTTYVEGVDYTFEVVDIGGRSRPSGRIIIPTGSAFLDSGGNVQTLVLSLSYIPDPDITHKVTRIDGNNITLDHSALTTFDAVEITYRYIPVSPSQIIKSSIRVSDLPTTSPSRVYYVEGRDYVIDPGTGGIQRIPTGDIPNQGEVYVQYSYRESSSTLQTFTTWCYIAPDAGAQIKLDLDPTTKKNKLVVDKDAGESFYVNSKEGLINITNATATPVLPFGWVQFIVRSKSPDTNASYKTNLIDQVIQLKDVNKKKVFKQYSYYFNEISAYREPLVEKTLNHLKVNTLLSDHSSFAIDSTTDPFNSYIVLNFKPNETTELYSKVPTADADESNPPETTPEDFIFEWSEKINTESAPSQIVLKVELNRDQNIDGAMSPKVFSYQVRVGT